MHSLFRSLANLLLAVAVTAGCEEKSTEPAPPPLMELLQALPGCTVEEIEPPAGAHYTRAFQINVTQPVDHDNPNGPTFTQRVLLSHVDVSAPMVLVTWGYDVTRNRSHELPEILRANQLLVAHRYGGDNRPDPVDWTYMTIEQTAADHHRIVELFKDIYTGPWANYGLSKGGMAAAFHRRFYPDDVRATVSGVAPFFNSVHDLRVDDFLMNVVGADECREKIRQLQRFALSRRDSLLPLYEQFAETEGYTFTRIGGIEAAFEFTVLEYSYVFWQYYGAVECDQIPDTTVSSEQLFEYMQRINPVSWLHDAMCQTLEPYFYQFYTQTGYYGYVTGHLGDLLEVVGDDPMFLFMLPPGVNAAFHPDVARGALEWLENEGMNIIYIYGEYDPCTAAAVNPGAGTNSIRIIQPGGTHFQNIRDLDQRQAVYDSLSAWLGVSIDDGS